MEEERKFHWADYLVLVIFLAVSAGIGVYYGLQSKKAKDAKDFLTGGGSIPWWPVALSMMASFLSAVFVLGIPAEIYFNGSTYSYLCLSYFSGFGIAAHVFMPLYYNLKLTSAYEYLERRFNKTIRVTGALCFATMMIVYMGVVLYTPALALVHVSGLDLWLCIIVVGAVVTTYTAMGGMKATVWNDALQMMILLLGFTLMIILGSVDKKVGGLTRAVNLASDGRRIMFDATEFNPDPFIRTSFWTMVVGGTVKNITLYASSQAVIQKFLSVSSVRDGQKAVWLSCVTNTLLMVLVVLVGSVMYAYYADCDPLSNGDITKKDQLIPFFIMATMGEYHGLPGLLIAAVFSASLSTISGGVNALSAVFLEDMIKPVYKRQSGKVMGAQLGTIVTRCLAILFGLVTIGLAFMAETMGDLVLQISNSIFGMLGGPLTGVIFCGMFLPFINSVGVLVGLVVSLIVSLWIGVGSIVAGVKTEMLSLTTENCVTSGGANDTLAMLQTTAAAVAEEQDYLYIYNLSYMYYSFIAVVVCMVVAIPVSWFTGNNKQLDEMDPMLFLLMPDFCGRCCSEEAKTKWRCGVITDEEYYKQEEEKYEYVDEIVVDPSDNPVVFTIAHSIDADSTREERFWPVGFENISFNFQEDAASSTTGGAREDAASSTGGGAKEDAASSTGGGAREDAASSTAGDASNK